MTINLEGIQHTPLFNIATYDYYDYCEKKKGGVVKPPELCGSSLGVRKLTIRHRCQEKTNYSTPYI
jgi:hypothetical protein